MRRRFFFPGGLLLLFTIVNAAIFFFTRTGTSRTNQAVFQELEESLTNSNMAINFSSETIFRSLDEKTRDPATSAKATIWLQKADSVQKYTQECYKQIEILKSDKKLTGRQAAAVLQNLNTYKKRVLAVDEAIRQVIYTPQNEFFQNDSTINSGTDFCNKYFKNASFGAVNAFLTKLQNSIKTFENRVIMFCNEQITIMGRYHEFYSGIIAQNSAILKPGEKIEIITGVGYFSVRANPETIINNKIIPITEDGLVHYTIKSQTKPGRYSIPVLMTFTDQDGKKVTIEKDVEYTVAKECDQ